MSTTQTFTSNGNFVLAAPALVTITCVGAGGHGSRAGNGGSGGGYAVTRKSLQAGTYPVVVGQATATDGGNSYLTSGSTNVIICRAPGGKMDGTITHQTALLTGSEAVGYGGHGSPDFLGYASYNGSGGGECGTGIGDGNGQDGQSAYYSTGTAPASGGASAGFEGNAGQGAGGAGSFYYAGPNVNQVFAATAGTYPGGGGGGSYDYGTDNSGAGAGGLVRVVYG